MADRRFDVFVSSSRQARAWASEFTDALKASGVDVWFADVEVRPGDRWEEALQKALRDSRTLVAILTPDSVHSSSMYFEIGAAVADGKRIIPVLTEGVDWHDVPTALASFQALKEQTPTEAAKKVADALKTPGAKTSA